ncbi:MAG: IPT/TIG domain-containing protein [Treponema sp.]|jgi:transglutaminase-like putative cysteine protease|nr:IPT/TIG domain-containing protein [Treponema sp.]
MRAAFLLAAVLLALAACQPKAPVIHSISPQIGTLGEPVTIRGAFFGKERNESYITIAGSQPTSMSYIRWQDNEIAFRIPEFGETGLVYVHVKGRRSNGVLFTSQATLPVQVQGAGTESGPRIASITPQSGAIGALISISGMGFGSYRGNGGVFFSWNAQESASAPMEARLQEFAEASEAELGYELWTDKEIQVRVPDGADPGNLEVRTARGSSPPAAFNISGRPGTKAFFDKRSYTLNYSVNVKASEARPPNALYLWIPRPAVSAAQRNAELLSSSMEPFIERHRGISLYKIDDIAPNRDVQISLSWKVDVYGVGTSVWPQAIRQESNSPMMAAYAQSSPQLPSDDPRIKSQAAAILGRERNPYAKAQRIYEWMTAGGNFVWEAQSGGDIFSALETKKIDSYLAALLYCTLLRSADIPCQPVAGVLVSRNRQAMNHYWAEFWIDGFGWVPADPAMGATDKGGVPALFTEQSNQPNFYFGNMDSRRIAFSRGFISLSPMDPRGRTSAPGRFYSMQNIREEAVGGIDSYSSLWGDITITGIYAQ